LERFAFFLFAALALATDWSTSLPSQADDTAALTGAVEWADEVLTLAEKTGTAAACENSAKPGSGRIHESCCICFHDVRGGFIEHHKRFKSFCRDWLASSGCERRARFAIPLNEGTAKQQDFDGLPLSCAKVRVMGMFHGEPDDYWMPFAISKTLASRLRAREVCYDGKSCLLFNDLEKLPKCAKGIQSPECEFTISGNQNIFIMKKTGKWLQPKSVTDLEVSSSKTTVTIPRAGTVSITHDRCSPEGSRCGFVQPFLVRQASNDANQKTCLWNGKTVQQTCCTEKTEGLSLFVDNATWSAPGRPCR